MNKTAAELFYRNQTPEEIEADRISDELPDGDIPIPLEILRKARKHLLGVIDGSVLYPVKDQLGYPTGIMIQHQVIFDRPVLSIIFQDDRYSNGVHINVALMRTDAPVSVTVNKLFQDETGSYDVKTTKATL